MYKDLLTSVLFSSNEDWRSEYWCKPVGFREFITSKEHLNLSPLSPKQYEAIFKLIGTDPLKVFSMERIKHIGVFLWGKGSGKDYATSILIAYLFYLLLCMRDAHDYFNFPKEEGIDIINVAKNAKQARKIFFSKFTARITNWKWLMENFRVLRRGKPLKKCTGSRMEIRITDASVETQNNIRCNSEHSEAGGYEGYNILAAIMDETSDYDTDTDTSIVDGGGDLVDIGKAEFIYNTLRTSAVSRKLPWLMVIISFPRMQGDWTIRKYEDAVEDIKNNPDTSIFVAERGCTWEYNPRYFGEKTFKFEKWDIPLTFESDFKSNPSDSKMRYCTEPPLTINAFFYFPQRIYDAIDPTIKNVIELEPRTDTFTDSNGKQVNYIVQRATSSSVVDKTKAFALHGDMSISKDSTIIGVGHGEPCESYSIAYIESDGKQVVRNFSVRVIIDQLIMWEPTKTAIVSSTNVDEIVELLADATGLRYISFDQYQSQFFLEKAVRKGIDSEKHNINDRDYLLFRNLLHAGKITYPNHKKLIFEMEKLSYDGKRVDHLPQYSKDVCDVVCGIIRAVATGLAKATDTFSFTFAGNEIFGDASPEEVALGQVRLPDECIPGSEQLLNNRWGL